MRILKKALNHPIYWIRYGFSFLVLWPGFWIYDLGKLILVLGNKLMDLAVAIEGDVPDGTGFQTFTTNPVRTSGQAVPQGLVVSELQGSPLREDAKKLDRPIKLVLWTDQLAPGIEKVRTGVISFFDYESLWDFKIGDRIHYATKAGTTVYEIYHIEPANLPEFDRNLRKVLAREMRWKNFTDE